MRDFVYKANPARVVFGSGTISKLPGEIDHFAIKRALIIATPQQKGQAEEIAGMLSGRSVGVFSGARMHTPLSVTREALDVVKNLGVDGVISVGGGSTIGLGKAISIRTSLPHIAVPTTYAGSEVTPILGETEDGKKVTRSDPRILPNSVLYDVDMTLTLPVSISVTSGFNAMAHAVEALYARESNPVISLLAEKGIGSIYRSLPRIKQDPFDVGARSQMLYGAWLCGVCLGSVGMALHHKLCHTLGGMFDLPHAELHTAILPHALYYNASAAPEAVAAITSAIEEEDAPYALYESASRLGATMSVASLGMPENCIERVVEQVLANPYWNPRELESSGLGILLRNAFHGTPPAEVRRRC